MQQVREKLGCDAVLMQLPIGKEDNFEGVVDLITMKAVYFDGNNGEKVRREAIPADMQEEAKKYRHAMLESLSMYSDELMELLLAEADVPEELIHDTVAKRRAEPGRHAGVHGHGLQKQRRAAAAGRDRPLFAFAAAEESRGQELDTIPTKNSRSKPIRPSRSSAWRSRSSKIRTAS